MKRTFAFLMAALMLAGSLMLAACSTTETPTPSSAASETTTAPKTDVPVSTDTPTGQTPTASPTDTTTDAPTETPTPEAKGRFEDLPDVLNTPVKRQLTEARTHTKAEELPAQFSLVDSGFLPALTERPNNDYANEIDKGTYIINPAADAVTYFQFTNAVARYLRSLDPSNTWDPAQDYSSCFSPKFTGQYAKSITGNYDVLRDNGCLTISQDDYARDSKNNPIVKKGSNYQTQTTGWKVEKGVGEESLKYRLVQYEYYNTSTTSNTTVTTGYYDTKLGGVNITGSDNGKLFLDKIRDAVVTGNVVVAQGIYETWQLEDVGGDSVIAFSLKVPDGTSKTVYQLCIVGYDDAYTVTTHGVTLTGAFLVCNPGNAKWGNNGYAWVMYDALNTFCSVKNEKGESAFVFDDPENDERVITLDVFTFTYWDRDITEEKPQLYAEVEVETANRSAFSIYLSKVDAFGRTSTIETYTTYHVHYDGFQTYGLNSLNSKLSAPDYEFFNFAGTKNGKAVTAFYTVSFERLLSALPEGATYENFDYALSIESRDAKHPVTVKSIVIKNKDGQVVRTITMPKNETVAGEKVAYEFNFGKDVVRDVYTGKYYKFKNLKTNQYMINDRGLLLMTGATSRAKEAYLFRIVYNTTLDRYVLWLKEATTDEAKVLDITKGQFTDGNTAQFNPESAGSSTAPGSSFDTQFWGIAYNDDGTVTFYLRSPEGQYFALAVNESSKIVIVPVADALTDAMKWVADPEFDVVNPITAKAEKTDGGLKVDGTLASKKITEVTVKVSTLGGTEVASVKATPDNKTFSAVLPVTEAGEYLVTVTHETTADDGTVTTVHSTNSVVITVG